MSATAWHDEGVDDRALIDAVRGGDASAFGLLVERETAGIYRACLRIVGSSHEAEELTQEAFMTAYRAIATFRGDGSLRGWLHRIAQRTAFRRLAQRRPTAPLDAIPEPRPADAAADPTHVVVADEERAAIREAVLALPEPYREVVALRFFADFSLAEVAEATGRPVNTVKTHLRRGLERLRPALGEGADR